MLKYLLIFLIFSNFIKANEIQEKTEAIIKENFGDSVLLKFVKYDIPHDIKLEIELLSKQKFFSESVYLWFVSNTDSIIAIGIMDNVYGKMQPITFITFFNPIGEILSNHVVKYREEHGGAVANYNWNKQFIGFNEKSNYYAVDGISGATISVNSIKRGVMKLALLFSKIKDKALLEILK